MNKVIRIAGLRIAILENKKQMSKIAYDRKILVETLVYHYRKDITSCGCGWAELGRSHPEHVANIYEESIRAREGD